MKVFEKIAIKTPYASPSSLWLIFRTLLGVGLQSFGGGSSTFYLIHEACRRYDWMGEEEFVRSWALAQVTPGINLIKLTILIGNKLRGAAGIAVAVGGLLLPSVFITALMTAGYSAIRSLPIMKAILRGVLPAALGLSLAMGVQMATPLLFRARGEGWMRLGISLGVIVAAGLLLAWNVTSPLVVLLLGGGVIAFLFNFIPPNGGRGAS